MTRALRWAEHLLAALGAGCAAGLALHLWHEQHPADAGHHPDPEGNR